MTIHFYKYQGAGNDFILIDHRMAPLQSIDNALIKRLCDRRFGIGADGLMFLLSHSAFDFEMVYYNADGRVGSMCGNGGRCIVAFAKHLGIIDKEAHFLAVDGEHYAKISADGTQVDLQMIDVPTIGKDGAAYVLNTGSPHYVLEVNNLETRDMYQEGKAIRNNATYKTAGINVNFVEDRGDHLFVRTFERGVEDETYACGTGATAVALAMARDRHQQGYIETAVQVLGGRLSIRFNDDGGRFTDIFLCGPAHLVFEGQLSVP